MIYSERDLEYFKGERFKTQFDMRLTPNKLVSRLDCLKELCRGKNVIHVGCCDHVSIISEKVEKGIWLHGILDEQCEKLQGIDICDEAVNFCNQNNLCKMPILLDDCTSCTVEGIDQYDIILMAEMIEHINNPVEFLEKTYKNFRTQGFRGKYILTAPNALGLIRRNIFKKGVERINTDHKYWFSPYTLAKIMMESGITPESCEFVQYASGNEEEESYMSDSILVIGH